MKAIDSLKCFKSLNYQLGQFSKENTHIKKASDLVHFDKAGGYVYADKAVADGKKIVRKIITNEGEFTCSFPTVQKEKISMNSFELNEKMQITYKQPGFIGMNFGSKNIKIDCSKNDNTNLFFWNELATKQIKATTHVYRAKMLKALNENPNDPKLENQFEPNYYLLSDSAQNACRNMSSDHDKTFKKVKKYIGNLHIAFFKLREPMPIKSNEGIK